MKTCDHAGIGLPGCPTCDPRTISEGGPRAEDARGGYRCGPHRCRMEALAPAVTGATTLRELAARAPAAGVWTMVVRIDGEDVTFGVEKGRRVMELGGAMTTDAADRLREAAAKWERRADSLAALADGIAAEGRGEMRRTAERAAVLRECAAEMLAILDGVAKAAGEGR